MVASEPLPAGYVIPRYRALDDVTWYHVLHGNVPGHQIDFMYGPEVPQGPLTPTHFNHLARLMKYIEPQTSASHAFAIGNLSRDDTHHEPGHGAVGIIFGMRIGGATDHAGRQAPPFAHAILAVDRELTPAAFREAAAAFYRRVMHAGEASSPTADFYRVYIRSAADRPHRVLDVLEGHIETFHDLPPLPRSALTWDWLADESAQPKRVVIVHPDAEDFGAIARAAASIAALLYRSNIRWTSITTGREADIPGGVSIRFLAERDLTPEDRRGPMLRIEDLGDETEIARALGAKRNDDCPAERPRYAGWRERFAADSAPPEPDPIAEPAFPAAPPDRRPFSSAPPSRESGPRQLGEHGTAIMQLPLRQEAVVRPPAAFKAPPSDAPPPPPAAEATPAELTTPPPSPAQAPTVPDEIEVTIDTPPEAKRKRRWLLGATALAGVASVIGAVLMLSGGSADEGTAGVTAAVAAIKDLQSTRVDSIASPDSPGAAVQPAQPGAQLMPSAKPPPAETTSDSNTAPPPSRGRLRIDPRRRTGGQSARSKPSTRKPKCALFSDDPCL